MLREALALWRGPALADVQYESFARNEIGRLEELRLVALGLRVEADLALGRDAEVVPELEALVREHPLREGLRELLILALYRAGPAGGRARRLPGRARHAGRRARPRPGRGAAAAREGDPAARPLARSVGRGRRAGGAADRHRHVPLHRRRGVDGAARSARARRVRGAARRAPSPAARGVRRRGRPRGGHAGRRVLRRVPERDGCGRGGGPRPARVGGDAAADPDRDPHRRAVGRADGVRRPRRPARRADLRGRPRRAGADLAGDARAGRGRAARRDRAARPRRASAQGPDAAAAALAARDRRAAERVPGRCARSRTGPRTCPSSPRR